MKRLICAVFLALPLVARATFTPVPGFGSTGGALVGTFGNLFAQKETLSAPVSLTALLIDVTGPQGANQIRGLVYADNAGAPGALIAMTAIVDTNTMVAGLNALPFNDGFNPTSVSLAAGDYWIGFYVGTGALNTIRYSTPGGTPGRFNSNGSINAPPNPFGALNNSTAHANLAGATGVDPRYALPQNIMGAFGRLDGNQTVVHPPDVASTQRVIIAQRSTLAGMITNASGAHASAKSKRLLFADNGSGYPGTLLAQTPEKTGITVGYNVYQFSTPITLNPGTYWLGFATDSNLSLVGSAGDGYGYFQNDTYSDGVANPFPGGGSFSSTRGAAAVYTVPVTASTVTPNSGLTFGGTFVTIDGNGFSNTTSVTFGGVPATNVVVVDDLRITCTTPAHDVGPVAVAVTANGVTATIANGFTYIAGREGGGRKLVGPAGALGRTLR